METEVNNGIQTCTFQTFGIYMQRQKSFLAVSCDLPESSK